MAAWYEPPREGQSRWSKLDTWPNWAWVVVIVVEVTIGLIGFKYS